MSLAEDIERDYECDFYAEQEELILTFKSDLFETFIWFNRYGEKVDVRKIDDNYFKNICRMLVKNHYFTNDEIDLLKKKRIEYRKVYEK